MTDINRRKILQGISLSTGIAIAPLNLSASTVFKSKSSIAFYVNPLHGKFKHSTSNEIINTSQRSITLNPKQPIAYKSLNGKNVALYINSSEQKQYLAPGERAYVHAKSAVNLPKDAIIL